MTESKKLRGALFDLDGVIVDTAKYHYLAWKELANSLGFDFTEKDNERLKGVSRVASLNILLGIGGLELDEERKTELAAQKNKRYVECLGGLTEDELLPGARECLVTLREMGVKIALGSASKNAPTILEKLKITDLFDAIIDGNEVSAAKPDPEVFQKGADHIGIPPRECAVFEDAQAGIDAALSIGCVAVAVGTPENLKGADLYIDSLKYFDPKQLF